MQAIIFGKFPKKFVESSIIPKLEEYGLDIVGIEERPKSFSNNQLEGVDVVLFMSELAAHKELQQIQKAIERSGTKLVYLSRKASQWPEQFGRAGIQFPIENTMARPPAVKDLDGFFLKYIELKQQGHTHEDMVPYLRKFWPDLASGKNIASFLSRQLKHKRDTIPQFYFDFIEKGIVPEELREQKSETSSSEKINDSELLTLADEENNQLRSELEELRRRVKELQHRETDDDTVIRFKQNINMIRQGVPTGLFSKEEALDKIFKMAEEL